LGLHNRQERLEAAPDGSGFDCQWQWTSDLHAPKVLPSLGRRLSMRAFADHPVVRASLPETATERPAVSFIIGHRGLTRLAHLLATLESIAGQKGVDIECLVVEQDQESVLRGRLPPWVRHVHTPPPAPDMPYCRSWTFNVGVQYARAGIVVLHDNDMLVPVDYAAQVLALVKQDFEVINLKRFVFYLDPAHTESYFSGRLGLLDHAPEVVTQNLEGGGSVAITRAAFEAIGGMDESFVGWGGEDNEFWERAQTRKVWRYAGLPIWHLWHPAQAGKLQAGQQTLLRLRELSKAPVLSRISTLRGQARGQAQGPFGWSAPVQPCAE
jgi:hypothetical protein